MPPRLSLKMLFHNNALSYLWFWALIPQLYANGDAISFWMPHNVYIKTGSKINKKRCNDAMHFVAVVPKLQPLHACLSEKLYFSMLKLRKINITFETLGLLNNNSLLSIRVRCCPLVHAVTQGKSAIYCSALPSKSNALIPLPSKAPLLRWILTSSSFPEYISYSLNICVIHQGL